MNTLTNIITLPFKVQFEQGTESEHYQTLIHSAGIYWQSGEHTVVLHDEVKKVFVNERGIMTFLSRNDIEYFNEHEYPEITKEQLELYCKNKVLQEKPTDLFITTELFNVLNNTLIPCDTNEQDTDANGLPKFTSAGNIVYKKQNFVFEYITNLKHESSSERLRINGQVIAVQQPPMGNYFSLKRKGTYLPGVNDVSQGDCWKKDKRQTVEKWSKFISHFVKYLREHGGFKPFPNTYSLPSNDVMTEKLIESIKMYFSEEYLTEIVPPSSLYTEDYFNGDGLGSCMSHFNDNYYSNRINVKIYDTIPELKGLLFKKIDGTPVARCLLWSDKYHDRIYGIGHDEIRIAEKTCALRNWEFVQKISYKTQAGKEHESLSDYVYYPYMDNVKFFFIDKNGVVSLATEKWTNDNTINGNVYQLTYTDDQSEEAEEDDEDYVYCEISGDRVHQDDACYIDYYGWVCNRYAIWSEYHQEDILERDAVEVTDARGCSQWVRDDCGDIIFSEILDDYIFLKDAVEIITDNNGNTDYVYNDDATYCEIDDINVHNDDATELYDGTYAPEWNTKEIDISGDDNNGKYIHVDKYDEYCENYVPKNQLKPELS